MVKVSYLNNLYNLSSKGIFLTENREQAAGSRQHEK
jgi:hypothetical protein